VVLVHYNDLKLENWNLILFPIGMPLAETSLNFPSADGFKKMSPPCLVGKLTLI